MGRVGDHAARWRLKMLEGAKLEVRSCPRETRRGTYYIIKSIIVYIEIY